MYRILNTDGYEKLMSKYHISSLAAKFMISNNLIMTKDIIKKDSKDYIDIEQVTGLVFKAMAEKKKIAIYGDYDVDGICSVSILYRTFQLLNYEVGYYIPSRYQDGYGITVDKVKQMKEKGYSLIICVDNGIKAFDAIKEARNNDIDIIVLDHHQKEEQLPDFNLYLHPEYSGFSDYNMCGASICYYVSKALLGESDEKCLALAGIATLGDVMPLVNQNKVLVHDALKILNKYKYRAIDLLNIDKKKYDENVISMQIVPKLNSIGRICKKNTVNTLVKYLTIEDEKELNLIAKFIEDTNEKRKEMTDFHFKNLDKESYLNKIIIEKDEDMLEGINGIIAARFANKYKVPAIVFSSDETKQYYKGSARSVQDYDIIELFKKNEYILNYGGHKGAAGLTIKKEEFELFYKKIVEQTKDNEYNEKALEVIEINEDELSYKAYQDLLKFSPFGERNSSPLFIIKNINKNRIKRTKDGKHIQINFNNEANLIGFNLANELNNDIINYDVIFKLEENNYYNKKISCKCIKLEVCETCMNK